MSNVAIFNSAIFWKTMRDSAWIILATAIGITAFVVVFVQSMMDMGVELMEFVSKFEFLKKIFEFGFGLDVSGEISLTVLFALCFTHGLVLLMSWSTVIAITTRVTAGEIGSGTADILLTLPVTRQEVYLSTSLVWMLAAMLLAVCPVFGVWIGTMIFETDEVIEISRFIAPAANFLFLLFAVGGISSMASSMVDRRSVAIGIVAIFLVVSSVLNFVAPFIEAVGSLQWLGVLSYFRPVDIVRDGGWPVTEIFSLFAIGLTTWLIGWVTFCKRDIPTA